MVVESSDALQICDAVVTRSYRRATFGSFVVVDTRPDVCASGMAAMSLLRDGLEKLSYKEVVMVLSKEARP